MTDNGEDSSRKGTQAGSPVESQDAAVQARRPVLRKLGRFAAVTAPAVTLLLAAQTKPAKARPPSSLPPVSSLHLKTREGEIAGATVLAAVAALPVEAWRYKPETGLEQRTHIVPYAEDFRAAFGVGDGVTIGAIDGIGVCLAAIKALSAKVERLEAELRATREPA